MKTEEHKAQYAIFAAISEKEKRDDLPHYYINRNLNSVFITAYRSDKHPCVDAVPAGRITCRQYNYCQIDISRILLAASNYNDGTCKMLNIFDRGLQIEMDDLQSYPGIKRNFFTMCKVSCREAWLIGGFCVEQEIDSDAIIPSLRYSVDSDEWHSFSAPLVPRFNCSSCCVNGFIYLFCGEQNNYLG